MSSDDSDYDFNTEEPINGWGDGGESDPLDVQPHGIPTHCHCGGRIIPEVLPNDGLDMTPGKRFFICEHHKEEGPHCRQPWVLGVEGEIEKLTKRVDEAEAVVWQVRSLLESYDQLNEEVKGLKKKVEMLEKVVFDE